MHIGVEITCQWTIFFQKPDLCLIPGKLSSQTLWSLLCRFVISLRNICNGYRFWPMLFSYPVCIGKVDTKRRCRMAVPSKLSNSYYLGRNTFHLFFLVLGTYSWIILKPLSIITYNLCPFGCLKIFEVHNSLPCSLHSQRIIVILNKSVNKVNLAIGVLNPCNIILIPYIEIACAVILNQFCYITPLSIVFGNSRSFFKMLNNFFNSRSVKPANSVNLLLNLAVNLYKSGVKAIWYWRMVFRVNHFCIKLLSLAPANTIIEVYGTS